MNSSRFPNCFIYDGAIIEENVKIGFGSIIYPNVTIKSGTIIGPYCTIGEPSMSYYKTEDYEFHPTYIGHDSIIRSYTIIYENTTIGDYFQTGHRVTIRECSKIGMNCSIGTLSDIQGMVNIGNYVRLHSNVHVGQLSTIEDYVWIYPYVVLTNDPYPPMGVLKGVTIKEFAQVATSAVVMPGVTVGKNALVGACSVVKKDVNEERVVVGVPGKDVCSVRELKNDKGEAIYPWKDYLKDFRGYPWQVDPRV